MQFDVDTVNNLLGIDDSYKAPEKLLKIMLDKNKREELFKKFLAVSSDLKFDWFHEYFEDEQSQRKKMKQDFTPDGVGEVLNKLASINNETDGDYYEPAAGTGGILIKRWWKDCTGDSRVLKKDNPFPWLSIFTYDPRRYFYWAEELSDRAIPFLIFNMAIRGMNGLVIQCDVLERTAKEAYLIRNDNSDFMAFSEVFKVPHSEEFEEFANVKFEDSKEQ